MSLLRKFGVAVGILLMSAAVISTIILSVLTQITDFTTMKPVLTETLKGSLPQLADQSKISIFYKALKFQCDKNPEGSIKLPLDGQELSLECSVVSNSTEETILDNAVGVLFQKTYYKDYGCDFMTCVSSGETGGGLLFLSSSSNTFFRNTMGIAVALSIIFALLVVGASETWDGRLKALGITLLIDGIPFFFVGSIKAFIPNIEGPLGNVVSTFLDKVIAIMAFNFQIVFFAGVLITIAGFILGFAIKGKAGKTPEKKEDKKKKKQ